MSEARVITTTWPVVIIVGPTHWDSAWVIDLGRQLDGIFARRERFAIVTDTRPIASPPGAKERKVLTDWLMNPDIVENQKRWNVGSATIIESALTRGALQALYWLWTPPTTQYVARDLDDGWLWCIDALTKAGVSIARPPSDLRAIAHRELGRDKPARSTPSR